MPLTPGTRLGPYEVVAPLGAGGMGEVYRARDPRLSRDVAIKALPTAFAQDPERLARFEREAKLLASLSHPNIAGILGLEEVAGARYLVLEMVEGETLDARVSRGALPGDEALAVCQQIATAVEAAHEAGVIHRDLKPGNVMLKPDGTVKVLDFGLAKTSATGDLSGNISLSASPTMTYAATGAGMVLGTAAYMSPEQARGKMVDRRTDIWSFGCVLYECLTGKRAFEGETVSDLVAKILEREPDWTRLPSATPPRLRELLLRCLRKDAKQRLRDIGDARLELEEIRQRGGGEAEARTTKARGPSVPLQIALAVIAALAGVVATKLVSREPTQSVTRLSVMSPDPDADFGGVGSYAIAPDGRTLVFTLADSAGTVRLFVRSMATDATRPLEGTEGATWPFWSPDSRDIAFFSDGRLRRVPVSGGAVRSICDASNGRGGSWGSRGVIVFAPDPRGGLVAVETGGGVPRPVTVIDTTADQNSHRFPSFLPDGRHFLFIAIDEDEKPESQVFVGSLDNPRAVPLFQSGTAPVFAAPDRVVFTRDRALLAQRIDLGALRMVGESRLLGDQPDPIGPYTLTPAISCSRNGAMVYTPRDRRFTRVAWLERDGRLTDTRVRFPAAASTASLAPDGKRVVVSVSDPEGFSNWVGNLEDGSSAQVTPVGKGVAYPAWIPAGTRFIGPPRGRGLRQVDPATGADSLIDTGDRLWHVPVSWTPDGRLILATLVEGNRSDLQTFTLRPGERPHPYLATVADEIYAMLSHSGRWIAYQSNASGRGEYYLERFPERTEAVRVTMISAPGTNATLGGIRWRSDDRELYFIGGDGFTLYAADVQTTPQLSLGAPRAIRQIPRDARDAIILDDGRLLVFMPEGNRSRSITVATGWMNKVEEKR